MKHILRPDILGKWRHRRGAATLDYVLVLGTLLPLAAFCISRGQRIIRLAYEMVCVLVGWPFM